VAAGIAILQEGGGLVTTANAPEDAATAGITDVSLGSRLCPAIVYMCLSLRTTGEAALVPELMFLSGPSATETAGQKSSLLHAEELNE